MQASDLVLRFVSSTGNSKEAQFYLSLFRAERPESFAIIAVAGPVMREAAGALIMDLRFLAQLGLTPVVVFGLTEPEDMPRGMPRGMRDSLPADTRDSIPAGRRDGLSGTSEHAARVARYLSPDVRAEVATPALAKKLARAGVIPLIPLDRPDIDHARSDRSDARFDALAALVRELGTRKIIFIEPHGGLQPDGGPTISLVDLTTEYDVLMHALGPEDAALLGHIRRLVDAVPHRLTVAVTSPLDLLRELFTVRGAGTLVRRGSVVVRHDSYQTVDRGRLRELIESAFHKRLVANFFDRPIAALYVADDYRGVAVVSDTAEGPYLSKFAVGRRAQGEGVGRDLWRALIRDYPSFYWRSRLDNPIAAWYQQQCDGMSRTGSSWCVFWRGLPLDRLPAAIELALAAPPDFESTAG